MMWQDSYAFMKLFMAQHCAITDFNEGQQENTDFGIVNTQMDTAM